MSRPLYGTDAFREAAGDTLRPGGLELTRYGVGLMAEAGLPEGGLVLDAGCGTGASARYLARRGFAAVGIDWHPGPLAGCSAGDTPGCALGGGIQLVQGDFMQLPFVPDVFDAALCECTLSLAPDLAMALAGIGRVLKQGALLLVQDLVLRTDRPQPVPAAGAASPFLASGGSCLAGALSFADWELALAKAGFDVLHREDVSHALAVFMAKLVWYDLAGDLAWLLPKDPGGEPCTCAAEARRRYGYGLFLARKRS